MTVALPLRADVSGQCFQADDRCDPWASAGLGDPPLPHETCLSAFQIPERELKQSVWQPESAGEGP